VPAEGHKLVEKDSNSRFRFVFLATVAVAAIAFALFSWLRQPSPSTADSGTTADPYATTCPSKDPLTCYYVSSNRPVHGPQDVTFDGKSVPVVGMLPGGCADLGACKLLGQVGNYQVWKYGPTRIEATYRPPDQTGSG
jgi:hypothetical protein